MKVRITKEAKSWLTLAEAPAANAIIRSMKEDESDAKEYATMAVNCIGSACGHTNWCTRVLEADAEIDGNYRIWDAYSSEFGKESGRLDVWISFTARTTEGYIEGGAYLTDIWNITGDNQDELASHMYYRRYEEVK